jgi:PIN domain nuclease of toxin-antitoxin system
VRKRPVVVICYHVQDDHGVHLLLSMNDRAIRDLFGDQATFEPHLLLWAAAEPRRFSKQARALIDNPDNDLLFSAASLWEVAIKRGLGRDDFEVDARLLRRGLLDNGYSELPIISDHVVAIDSLPPIHKDPFDRILVAQATVEGVMLLTIDSVVSQYTPVQSGQCSDSRMRSRSTAVLESQRRLHPRSVSRNRPFPHARSTPIANGAESATFCIMKLRIHRHPLSGLRRIHIPNPLRKEGTRNNSPL